MLEVRKVYTCVYEPSDKERYGLVAFYLGV